MNISKPMGRPPRVRFEPGARFGRLVTVSEYKVGTGRSRWIVRCDCGNPDKVVVASDVIRSKVLSCGCIRVAMGVVRGKSNIGGTSRPHGEVWTIDSKTINEWAAELGVTSRAIRQRIKAHGHPLGKRRKTA
ncbi:hypothetical protein [Paraburkholderia sp. BCC1876]|uniref:hypothetical protein n=1 Tax=Paraburkholderia sp. BCC1876 TaxID=2676303 RepID=UPI0015925BED|nr:hypothetical protein [Paraburkholderia sp. BCC1876]